MCGRICYEACREIATDHGLPPRFPSIDVSVLTGRDATQKLMDPSAD
jgi:hypothetical protein